MHVAARQASVIGTTPRADAEIIVALATLACVLLVIYPLAALGLSVFLLLNLPAYTPRGARLALGLVAAFALALMAGARPLDPDASNDIDGYYAVYRSIASGHLEDIRHFGGGLEVALPLYFAALAVVLPPLSANGLMFCTALLSSLLMLGWVERTFYRHHQALRPALLGLCLLMLNLYFSTQLVRQYLALVVLLYACTSVGLLRTTLYLLAAASCHLTAVPFFLAYLLLRRGLLGWLVLLAFALSVRLYLAQFLVAFDVLPAAIAQKLVYYAENLEGGTAADLASLRMLILLAGISLLALTTSAPRVRQESRPWLAAPWMATAVHLVLLPVPLASLRSTLPVHSVVPGLIAHQMFRRHHGLAFTFVLNGLLLYKLAAFALAPMSGNLLTTPGMVAIFFV